MDMALRLQRENDVDAVRHNLPRNSEPYPLGNSAPPLALSGSDGRLFSESSSLTLQFV
jgi:hypothetical protein